jgi:hypothetical protein
MYVVWFDVGEWCKWGARTRGRKASNARPARRGQNDSIRLPRSPSLASHVVITRNLNASAQEPDAIDASNARLSRHLARSKRDDENAGIA